MPCPPWWGPSSAGWRTATSPPPAGTTRAAGRARSGRRKEDRVPHTIRVAHSPDSDDAFMFHALANGKIETGRYEFLHELRDIETLNQAAFRGAYEVSAVSFHAYCHIAGRYAILPHGASFGDGYGPVL
ncbi:MAG: hypothetical protein HYU38_03085, partial [Candidatus Tectomicrobia bacterium]|nr:hypothetical protein [Candidatus Tectomicrobia bacterium]